MTINNTARRTISGMEPSPPTPSPAEKSGRGGKEKGRQRVGRKPAPAPLSPSAPLGGRSGRPMDCMRGSITEGQKAAIWTIIRKHGMETEEFREWLRREFGTGSTRELSMQDAAEVIRSLKVFYGEEYEPYKGLTWGITKQQMRYIKALAREIGWISPRRLEGMINKMFPPKKRLELLNKKEATALIVALEKMGKDGKDYA